MHVKTIKPPSSQMKRTNGRSQEHIPGPGHPAKTPDIRPLEIHKARHLQKKLQGPDIRHPARTSGLPPEIRPPGRISGPGFPNTVKMAPTARTSGLRTGHSAPPEAPDIRHLQPGHPVPREPPDIRPDARTSGAHCLRAAPLGSDPCIPSPL